MSNPSLVKISTTNAQDHSLDHVQNTAEKGWKSAVSFLPGFPLVCVDPHKWVQCTVFTSHIALSAQTDL